MGQLFQFNHSPGLYTMMGLPSITPRPRLTCAINNYPSRKPNPKVSGKTATRNPSWRRPSATGVAPPQTPPAIPLKSRHQTPPISLPETSAQTTAHNPKEPTHPFPPPSASKPYPPTPPTTPNPPLTPNGNPYPLPNPTPLPPPPTHSPQ